MENTNFTDLISNAIIETAETIYNNLINKLEFDKTIKCIIEDDSDRANGKYKVSDGSTSFMAESDNKEYEKGTQVYVYVINNDLSENKIIIGQVHQEQVSEDGYLSPIERMIILDEKEIVKNTTEDGIPTTSIELSVNDINNELLIVEENNFIDHSCQYSTFGIAANFDTSTLGQNNIYSGDYGIKIALIGYSNNSNQKTAVEMTMGMDDFFGDPYFYTGFPQQEKTFPILLLDKITGYKLSLFKSGDFVSSDTSADLNSLFIKLTNLSIFFGYSATEYNETTPLLYTFTPEQYDDSNKTKNIITRFIQKTDDSKIIYNYYTNLKAKIDAMNADEDSSKMALYWYRYNPWAEEADPIAGDYWSILSTYNDNTYAVEKVLIEGEWDKFKEVLAPQGVGKYDWSYALDKEKQENNTWISKEVDFFSQDFEVDENRAFEKIKLIAVYSFVKEELSEPNEEGKQETVHTVGTSIYESNELRFNNKNDIKDIYLGLVKDFTLVPTGSYNGLFFAYDGNGNLQKTVGTQTIKANIKLINPGFNTQNNIRLRWFVPSDFTMFQDFKTSQNKISMLIDNEKATEEGNSAISADWTWANKIKSKENGGYWTDWLDPTAGSDKKIEPNWQVIKVEASAEYQIKKYYTPQNTNNKIICQIDYNGCIINKEIQILFGQSGNSGTSYTLTANLGKKYTLAKESSPKDSIIYTEDNVQYEISVEPQFGVILNNTETYYIELESQLYDFQNNLIDISKFNPSWSFYKKTNNTILNIQNEIPIYKKVGISNNYDDLIKEYNTLYKFNNGIKEHEEFHNTGENNVELYAKYVKNFLVVTGKNSDPYAILQVSTEYDGKTLASYIPLGFYDSDCNVNEYNGITSIIYDNDGANPVYYKDEHYLKKTDGKRLDNLTWKVEKFESKWEDTNTNQFFPTIEKTNDSQAIRIRPCSLIAENILDIPIRILAKGQDNAMIYSQSVLIQQNAYGNQMLNDWDGNLKIDQENNTILSAQMAAGTKNENNTFTGVLLGKVKEYKEISITGQEKTGTGLFGYFNGLPSFGFDSNGSAFIGQSGKGRIIFNPNSDKAIIQSENFLDYGDTYINNNLNITVNSLNDTCGSQWNLTDSSFKLYGEQLTDKTEPYSLTKFIINTKPKVGEDFFGIYVSEKDRITENTKILIPLMSIKSGIKENDKYEQGEFFLQSPGYYFYNNDGNNQFTNRFEELRELIKDDQSMFYTGGENSLFLNFKQGELISDKGIIGSWIFSPARFVTNASGYDDFNNQLEYRCELQSVPANFSYLNNLSTDLNYSLNNVEYNDVSMVFEEKLIANNIDALKTKPDYFVSNGKITDASLENNPKAFLIARNYLIDDNGEIIWKDTFSRLSNNTVEIPLEIIKQDNEYYLKYTYDQNDEQYEINSIIKEYIKNNSNIDQQMILNNIEFLFANLSGGSGEIIKPKLSITLAVSIDYYIGTSRGVDQICTDFGLTEQAALAVKALLGTMILTSKASRRVKYLPSFQTGIKKKSSDKIDSQCSIGYLGNLTIDIGNIGHQSLKKENKSIIDTTIPYTTNTDETYDIFSIKYYNEKSNIQDLVQLQIGNNDNNEGIVLFGHFSDSTSKGLVLNIKTGDIVVSNNFECDKKVTAIDGFNIDEKYNITISDSNEVDGNATSPLIIQGGTYTNTENNTTQVRNYVFGWNHFYVANANGNDSGKVNLGHTDRRWNNLYLKNKADIGSLTCSGGATVGSLTSNGNSTITGTLKVTGATTVNSLTCNNNSLIQGTILFSTNEYTGIYQSIDSATDYKTYTIRIRSGYRESQKSGVNSLGSQTYVFGRGSFYISGDNSGAVDLGTDNHKWNNLYLSGAATVGSLTSNGNSTITGNLSVTNAISIHGHNIDINSAAQNDDTGYDELVLRGGRKTNSSTDDKFRTYKFGYYSFYPNVNGNVSLGLSTKKWKNIYSTAGNITTLHIESGTVKTTAIASDMRVKETYLDSELLEKEISLYDKLQIRNYKYKDILPEDNYSRIHIGFYAQEVEKLIDFVGLNSENCALIQKWEIEQPEYLSVCEDGYLYTLNYNELHGLHVLKNHLQDTEIENLKQQVNSLNNEIELLQEELNQLKNNN